MPTFTFSDNFESNEFAEPTRWSTSGNWSFSNGDLVLAGDGTYTQTNINTAPYKIKREVTVECAVSLTHNGVNTAEASVAIEDGGGNMAAMYFKIDAAGSSIGVVAYGDGPTESKLEAYPVVQGDIYWLKVVEMPDSTIRFYYRKDGDVYSLFYTTILTPFIVSEGCYVTVMLSPFHTPPLIDLRIKEMTITSQYSEWDYSWYGHMDCVVPTYGGYEFAYTGYCHMATWPTAHFWPPPKQSDHKWPYPELFRTGSTRYYVSTSATETYYLCSYSAWYPDVKNKGDFFITLRTNGSSITHVSFTINGIAVVYDHNGNDYTISVDGTDVLNLTEDVDDWGGAHIRLIGNTLTFIRLVWPMDEDVFYEDTDFLGSPAEYLLDDILIDCVNGNALYHFAIYGTEALPVPRSGAMIGSLSPLSVSSLASWIAPSSNLPAFIFHFTGITGGTSSDLDGLDPTSLDGEIEVLRAGSAAWIIEPDNSMYLYKAIEAAGAVPNPPSIIIPVNNPGNWYWELVPVEAFLKPQVFKYTDLDFTGVPFPIEYARSGIISHIWSDAESGKLRDIGLEVAEAGHISAIGTILTGESIVLALPRRLRDLDTG